MVKKSLALFLGVIMISGLVGCSNEPKKNNDNLSKNNHELIRYKNGQYEGLGEGFNGEIKVNVKIDENKIKSVDILGNNDDEEYFKEAKALIPNIIKKQNPYVDTISGATKSSNGIIDAVKNALKKAN